MNEKTCSTRRIRPGTGRVRFNPTVTATSLDRLHQLAVTDHRDVSHELDALIEAEWRRRQAREAA